MSYSDLKLTENSQRKSLSLVLHVPALKNNLFSVLHLVSPSTRRTIVGTLDNDLVLLRSTSTRLFERARTNPCANLSFYTRSASDSDCAYALRAPTFVRGLCSAPYSLPIRIPRLRYIDPPRSLICILHTGRGPKRHE